MRVDIRDHNDDRLLTVNVDLDDIIDPVGAKSEYYAAVDNIQQNGRHWCMQTLPPSPTDPNPALPVARLICIRRSHVHSDR
jgi:hypothetical protein